MLTILTATQIFSISKALAQEQEVVDPFSIQLPSEFSEMIQMDQGGNILAFDPLPEREKEIIHLFHFEVGEAYLKLYLSAFMDEETSRIVRVPQENGDFKYRVFFAEDRGAAYTVLSSVFGEPKKEFYATKMQSHSTYFIWKPNTNLMAFLKLQGREGDTTTHDLTVKSAVETNTALEFLARQTHNYSDVSFFPERFGASLNLKSNVSYSYSMRSVQPTDAHRFPKGLMLYPAHGFFSSAQLQEILKRKGISQEEWIEKFYAPKLGEFIAITNFRYGIYTEAHTQNLLIKINANGEIQGFSFRDLADVAIDAMISLRSPSLVKLLSLYEGNRMLSRLGRNHVSDNGKGGAFRHLGSGWINGGYVGNYNFNLNSKNIAQAEKYFRSFFNSYLKMTSAVTGVKFDVNELEGISLFEHGKNYLGYDWFEYVYNKVSAKFLFEVENHWQNYDQKNLQKIFKRHFKETLNVGILRGSALPQLLWNLGALSGRLGSDVQYSVHQGKIFAFDRLTGRPIAFAYGLSPDETSEIQFELIHKHKETPLRKRDHIRRGLRFILCRKSTN
ncbi:MAG: hypothetical protein VX642_11470 [Bdellovibrionota bacterium]|nr:hypothetical protein [Bdellovibrionota bacterium]